MGFDTFQDHCQLRCADRDTGSVSFGKPESACLQALVPDGQPVTIPIQDLETVATPVAEHEQMAAQGIMSHDMFGHHHESIETPAHVTDFRAQVNARVRGDIQHEACRSVWIRRRSSAASNP